MKALDRGLSSASLIRSASVPPLKLPQKGVPKVEVFRPRRSVVHDDVLEAKEVGKQDIVVLLDLLPSWRHFGFVCHERDTRSVSAQDWPVVADKRATQWEDRCAGRYQCHQAESEQCRRWPRSLQARDRRDQNRRPSPL